MATIYATYSYYTTSYYGVAISEPEWNRLALQASQIVDQQTFDRAGDTITDAINLDLIDQIKQCVCALAEKVKEVDAAGGAAIASETVGRHSVSYVQGNSEQTLSAQDRYENVCRLYLGNTGLMYRGF